ncbi:MAG: hypothetical protein HON78_01125, partial [Legionellales bacterium]|nr:hypothetical protein [Legionellales bacterium]
MLSSIDVISIFPEMFKALSYGVSGKFLAKPDLTMRYWNPRDYADNERGYIDDALWWWSWHGYAGFPSDSGARGYRFKR